MTDSSDTAAITLQEDNELVRVTRFRFPPSSETGWHTHERDYVIVPTIGGTLTMIDDGGSRTETTIETGVSYFRKAGVHHNVINPGKETIEFVEIELK